MKRIIANACFVLAAAFATSAATMAGAQTAPSGSTDKMHDMRMPLPARPDRQGGITGSLPAEPDAAGNGMPGMDHRPAHFAAPQGATTDMENLQHGAMQGMGMGSKSGAGESMRSMTMGPMQGGKPPPNARDPDAYAEGTRRTALRGMEMADDEQFGRLLVNELEYVNGHRDHGQYLDAEAWYGGDHNKFWLKAEGERSGGHLDAFRAEALWDRVFATFWSSQVGLRHDTGGGMARSWLALGVHGLAPYWFEVDATGYVGSNGALAARLETRYELLFTQRLILQPKLEANVHSRNDAARGIGSGLSDVEFGLRLRYEIRRQFAPYIGLSWMRKFGSTAGFAREAGTRVSDTQAVAGIRFWF